MAEAAVAATAPVSQPTSQSTPTPETAPKAGETPAQTAVRLMKLKVDGQDLELPEDQVIALAQQGKSAHKRFQEAAATKKEAEAIVNYLKSNPKEAFKKLGIDVRKFSEDTLLELIQQDQMSPEQKKAFQNEQKLKQYEENEKAFKEKQRNEQMQALERQHMENYDKMFVTALSESGLPKTAYTVKRMAELMLVNVKKGLELEPSQLAKIVKEDYIAEQKAMYSNLDGPALMELFGKDIVKKIAKAQVAQYKSKQTNTSSTLHPKPTNETKSPMQSWKEFKKNSRSRFGS